MTTCFRRKRPNINEFLGGKLGVEVLSKYLFQLGKKINIRESMFINSNYLEIWNQLTAYYDRVREKYDRIFFYFLLGEYSGAGWRQVYRGSTWSSTKRGEVPWPSIFLHRPELHTQRLGKALLTWFPCYKSFCFKAGKATHVLSWMVNPWIGVWGKGKGERILRLAQTPEII